MRLSTTSVAQPLRRRFIRRLRPCAVIRDPLARRTTTLEAPFSSIEYRVVRYIQGLCGDSPAHVASLWMFKG